MDDVSAVVVTYNAMPWLERCLESLRGLETVVVDHGSADGTLELLERRFPEATVLRRENRGYGAGLNAGAAVASGRYLLLLNSDAWAEQGSVERLVHFAETHPRAAVIGPRSRHVDGSVQHTVRGFPTLWRLSTEYFFLRKLAPRSRALNAFYAAGFAHDEARQADWVMGYALLVRREAFEAAGGFDEDFFMFSEETDLCRRLWDAGWEVWFTPDAEFTHLGGGSTEGRWTSPVRAHAIGSAEAELIRRHLGPVRAGATLALIRVGLLTRWVTSAALGARQRARVFRASYRGFSGSHRN